MREAGQWPQLGWPWYDKRSCFALSRPIYSNLAKIGRVWTNMTQRDDSNDVLSNESVRLCRYHEDQPAAAGDLHLRTDGERKRSF